MATFERDALFAKSIVFIKRALAHRDGNHPDEFQLWAALALELLGKFALAAIHPALIADPHNAASLFAACGRPISTTEKTITGKTVFARLRHLDKKFDDKTEKFCNAIAMRRNEELHSGKAPFAAFLPDAWLPKYWETCSVILAIQNSSLKEWIGPDEAAGADLIVSKAITALEHAVSARIVAAKESFGKKHSRDTLEALRAIPWPFGRPTLGNQLEQDEQCPACGLTARLGFDQVAEELLEQTYTEDDESGPWFELVKVSYAADEFACSACGLRLKGRDELAAADLPLDTEMEEEREPEWESDYGNC